MTQAEKQGATTQPPSEWLISPSLTPGASLQISSLLEVEQLTPEVLELLAKFTRKLQAIEKPAPPPPPCPKLGSCGVFNKPCPELTFCSSFGVKIAAL
jgi:hypothetical protein